jgi:glycosyltransferase involved in cell wall biosynthesis
MGVKKKKILYVITKSVWGGAAKYIINLASGLDKNSFEIFIAAGGRDKLADEARKIEAKYIEIGHFQRKINIFSDILSFFEILKILFQTKPDVIHANSSKAGGVCGLAAFLSKILGPKPAMVFTAHGWAFHEQRPRIQIWLIKFLSFLTSLFYNKVICVSEFDRKSARKSKIAPERKLVMIHNGINKIDFLTRDEARQKLGLSKEALVIGNIAEWTKNKGVDIFLRAIGPIAKEKENLKILLIGSAENPEKESIKRLVQKLNLESKTILIETLPEAARYLRALDIFILTSRKEGLPYVLLEASLAELPIIATEVGGNPEIIEEEKTGILISPENPGAIRNFIQELIQNPSKRKILGEAAREKVEREFTLPQMRKETYKLYSTGSYITKG